MANTQSSIQSESSSQVFFPLVLFILTILALLADLATEAFYYFGDLPFGLARFATTGEELFSDAVYYSSAAFFVIAFPFFIASIFIKNVKLQNILYIFLTIVFTLVIVIFHADHEFMRYTGMHYTLADLQLYNPTQSGVIFGNVLGVDARGAYSSILLLVIPAAFWSCSVLLKKSLFRISVFVNSRRTLLTAILMMIWVVMSTNFVMAFYHENDQGMRKFMLTSYQMQSMPSLYQVTKDIFEIPNYAEVKTEVSQSEINKVRNMWSKANTDPNWSFVDDMQTPLKKQYLGQCKSLLSKRPNIILIYAETLRAWDIPEFNHEMKDIHTPFIQSLADGTADFLKENGMHSRIYRHHITNGQPTIFSFMAIHTGLPPHSSQLVQYFVDTKIHGFPESLRAHGYATEMVLSGNTKFDNKVLWARRWYGNVVSTDSRDDRISLAKLADFVRANVKAGKTYFGSLLTITNHLSYNLPEGVPSKVAPDAPLIERMYETLAYDDAAIQEFLTNLAKEQLLDNTVVIITGDHGFEFGEYSGQTENVMQGYATMKHNMNWVPLIILSADSAISAGVYDIASSHADIAPTILHIAGICDDNSYIGHSLFAINENNFEYAACGGSIAYENNEYSSIFLQSNAGQLYHMSDSTQRKDVAAEHPDVVEKMKNDAMTVRKVIDDVYINNKF